MLAPLLVHALALSSPQGDASAAPRGEFQAALSLAAGSSDWSGDPVGYSALKLGLRLFSVITPFAQIRLGYGIVDQRALTFLSLGVEGGYFIKENLFPRAFVAFVHQHEESMAVVAEQPFGAVLGIGSGIRHRAGAQMGLGLDVVVQRSAAYQLTVGPEVTAVYLTYSSGPSWYGLIGIVGAGHFRVF